MLEKLEIYNFQAQRELILDLSPTITTIVGESDVGKSSSLRALTWALTNESRRNITTWGKDETRIVIHAEGNVVERIKNKKKNVYVLNGQEYACLRASVPPEVDAVFNLCPDSIQSQHALTFWFTDTGGELAKKLNQIVNLEVVDFTFAELSSQVNKIRSVTDVYEERLEKRKKEQGRFKKLPKLQKLLKEAEDIQTDIAKNGDSMCRVARLFTEAINLQGVVKHEEYCLRIASKWQAIFERYESKRSQVIKLKRLATQYRNCEAIKVCNIDQKLLKACEVAFEDLSSNKRQRNRLLKQVTLMRNAQNDLETSTTRLIAAEKKLTTALEGACPLCGRGKTIKEHLDECCIEYTLQGGVK